MKLETILTILLTVALAAYMLRMIVNWVLLNRVNGTSYPNLRSPGPMDIVLTLRHQVRSAVKPWWREKRFPLMVAMSNLLSVLLYVSLFGLVICFIFLKNQVGG